MAKIAIITRTYGGQEGLRTRAGTKLAIGTPCDGLQVISAARFAQLVGNGLAKEWIPKEGETLDARPSYGGGGLKGAAQTVIQKQPMVSRTEQKRRRLANPDAPAAPRPLVNPAPGRTGVIELSQSSPEDQASVKANLGLRGRRKSQPSQSTTAGDSSPGQ